jgi:hypothetical protein
MFSYVRRNCVHTSPHKNALRIVPCSMSRGIYISRFNAEMWKYSKQIWNVRSEIIIAECLSRLRQQRRMDSADSPAKFWRIQVSIHHDGIVRGLIHSFIWPPLESEHRGRKVDVAQRRDVTVVCQNAEATGSKREKEREREARSTAMFVNATSGYRSGTLLSAASLQERPSLEEVPLRPRSRRRVSTDGSLKSKRSNGVPCRKWHRDMTVRSKDPSNNDVQGKRGGGRKPIPRSKVETGRRCVSARSPNSQTEVAGASRGEFRGLA